MSEPTYDIEDCDQPAIDLQIKVLLELNDGASRQTLYTVVSTLNAQLKKRKFNKTP